MNFIKWIMRSLCVILILCGSMSNTRYQSYCQQQFKFLFHDQDKEAFWIGENLYGDQCEYTKAIKIETGQNGVLVSEKAMESFDNWEEIDAKKEVATLDYVVTLNNMNRSWEYPVAQLKIKKPAYNAKLMNFYLEELNAVCGKGWNNAMGVNGRVLPKITTNKIPHLIYFHPEGLYFNYEISSAFYFPDTQYLLVFTHQTTKCVGGGSMHGFFIFEFH